MFWIVLAVLLTVSATLNAYQVVAADDRSTQLLRGGLSVTLLLLAALSLRKGLAERSSQEGSPGAIEAGKSSRRGLIPVLGVAILIVGLVVAGLAASGPRISMPESLAGHSRLHDPSIEQLEQSFETEVGGNSVVGVFGAGSQSRFLVAGFDTAPEPGRDMFGELAGGLRQTGMFIDVGSKTERRIGSVTYGCAPYSLSTELGGSVSATFCDWNDGESYGFVMAYDPTLDAPDLARQAYEAVVG
jgi:hypothetical protein